MKTTVIASALIGSVLGASITFLILDRADERTADSAGSSEVHNGTDTKTLAESPDPFAEGDDYYRLLLTDPSDLTQRDMCIAMWYLHQHTAVDFLGVNTGHEFEPVWNQRSPVEILEEQLEFWREFQAESARLEAEQQKTNETKKQNKPDMATPRKPSD